MRLYNTKDKLKPEAQIFLMLDLQHMLYWTETQMIYDKEVLGEFISIEEYEQFKIKLFNDINVCINIVVDINKNKKESISNNKNKNNMIKVLKKNMDYLQDYFKIVKEEDIIEIDFRAWFEKQE